MLEHVSTHAITVPRIWDFSRRPWTSSTKTNLVTWEKMKSRHCWPPWVARPQTQQGTTQPIRSAIEVGQPKKMSKLDCDRRIVPIVSDMVSKTNGAKEFFSVVPTSRCPCPRSQGQGRGECHDCSFRRYQRHHPQQSDRCHPHVD